MRPFFLWLGWVRLVRALERFLALPCVNEMTTTSAYSSLRVCTRVWAVQNPRRRGSSRLAAGGCQGGLHRPLDTHRSFVSEAARAQRGIEPASGCKTLEQASKRGAGRFYGRAGIAPTSVQNISSQSQVTSLAQQNCAAAHATASFQSSPAVAVFYGRARCRAVAQRCQNGPPPPRPLAQQK